MSLESLGSNELQQTPALSGAGLLGLVTAGMYDDPLSMYREYIQNAADAAAENSILGVPGVYITLDVIGRRIRIRDNGPGLSYDEALERLLPIGRSKKRLGTDRGFRGIGRLAGLAFAKKVSFITRASGDQTVTRIIWHSDRLPEITSTDAELEQAILDSVSVESLPGSDYPEHFFDVEITDVARHSADLLLNSEAVRDYVGEVCPVPVSTEFPFVDEIEELFGGIDTPLTLEVILEGNPSPIERPYGRSIKLSTYKEAEFTEFQAVHIPSIGDGETAAIGWIAHSTYLGAIPKEQRVRGIRARVGNIQIGGEAVFDDLFVEERFNRWCVGELHILDPRIVPNSRRDYFQPGPHLRNLENQLGPVLRSVSTRCRRQSTIRNRARKAVSSLCHIEDLHTLAISGYLTLADSDALVQKALQELVELRNIVRDGNLDQAALERLKNAEENLTSYSTPVKQQPFGDLSPPEIAVYQRVFGALAALAPSPGSATDLIDTVFALASKGAEEGSTGKVV